MAATEIPNEMYAVQVEEPMTSGIDMPLEELQKKVVVKKIPTPQPKSGQVLIRMERAPINPSDLGALTGRYGGSQSKGTKVVPGFEGCGVVVKNGGGMAGWRLVGKRVAITCQGSWAQYVVVESMKCIAMPDNMAFDEFACAFVNPLTCLAFAEIVRNAGRKNFVHTAAASALGLMTIKYCKTQNIDVLCVVRKQEQVDKCKEAGATHVFNSSEEGWQTKLAEECARLKCTIAFDAISGPITGDILKALPKNGVVYVYGALSGEKVGNCNTSDFIFENKRVEGFWLTRYIVKKSLWGKASWIWGLPDLLKGPLKTNVHQTYPITNISQAIFDYTKSMTKGKTLLECNNLGDLAETKAETTEDTTAAKSEETDPQN